VTTTDLQAAVDHVLGLRGVETPCETCHGMGVRTYPSTAGWRHEVGGATSTKDVCDSCWGTGDAVRTGVNLRRLFAEEDARVAARAVSLLGESVGVGMDTMRPAVKELAKELDAMSKSKNKPRPPWFSLACEQVAKSLRNGLEASK
jgi:hypothetical protein